MFFKTQYKNRRYHHTERQSLIKIIADAATLIPRADGESWPIIFDAEYFGGMAISYGALEENNQAVGQVKTVLIEQLRNLVSQLELETDFCMRPISTHQEAMERVQYLIHVIEDDPAQQGEGQCYLNPLH